MARPFTAARWQRYGEAYFMMAEQANYRPQAPGDGMGNVFLTPEQLADEDRLAREAAAYAIRFDAEEDTRQFYIGCSTFSTNRAFIITVEAARALAAGKGSLALDLLNLASTEIQVTTRSAK